MAEKNLISAEERIPDEYPEELAREEAPQDMSERRAFFAQNFHELDRDLSPEERQEWNSIYASYRGRSALHGQVLGVDPLRAKVLSGETGQQEWVEMQCVIMVSHRVRVIIPESELWEPGAERPDFVIRNMIGARIDYVITRVDRVNGFALASRRMATRAQRYYFGRRPALCTPGARIRCKVLAVGPRRCLVECYGHDLDLTQRELRYSAIPDLREEYHPGMELDCIVKSYDAHDDQLTISVKEIESNPFDKAEERHPVGSRRLAVISGKYAGGVFCNLPDGTVVLCSYSYQYEDADFGIGDTVILRIQRYAYDRKQIFGNVLTRW